MKRLKPAGGRNFADDVRRKFRMKKHNKKGIASSFTAGLLKSNTRDDSARKSLLQIYRATLEHCKFSKVEPKSRKRLPAIWSISLSSSASYEVQVVLDEQMNLEKVQQRSVNWVHGTIASGKRQKFSCNIF